MFELSKKLNLWIVISFRERMSGNPKGEIREKGPGDFAVAFDDCWTAMGPAASADHTSPAVQEWHGIYRAQRSDQCARQPDVSSRRYERRAEIVHRVEPHHKCALFGGL